MDENTSHKTFLTEEGLQKAMDELRFLKTEKRKLIAEKIESAKELGDLSENAEYSEAKDEQGFTEDRITELEGLLKYAEVVKSQTAGTSVGIGSTVLLQSTDGDRTYTVVGYNEANPATGRISNESPLGRALLGKKVGDSVIFKAPKGERRFTVGSIT